MVTREHQRKQSGRHLRIGGIFPTKLAMLVVIVDLPKERPTNKLELAEVMFVMRIIIRCERGELTDHQKRMRLDGRRQLFHRCRHHDPSAPKGRSKSIIQFAYSLA